MALTNLNKTIKSVEFQGFGPIVISAVTTAPTKGTTTVDSIGLTRLGEVAEIILSYRQTSAGTAGSGDYLYSLPNNLQFDLTKNPVYTGAATGLTTVTMQPFLLPTSGAASDNTNGAFTYVVPYSATQFRILTLLSSTSGTFHASANSPYSNANLTLKVSFKCFINGWTLTA